jgi:uncharacterized membrane protein
MTSSVVAAFYESQAQARRVLRALHMPTREELLDAALITGDESGKLKIVDGERDTEAGVIEAIFPPSVLAVKAKGREADRAHQHFIRRGFQQNLLKEIGENLPPGGAALVTVIEERWLTGLREVMASPVGFERYPIEAEAEFDAAHDQEGDE